MITIPHDDLARAYRRRTIDARTYATQVWQRIIDAHPFLASVAPTDLLAAVPGLPAEVVAAITAPDLLGLAHLLTSLPDAIHEETHVPITPTLQLVAWPERRQPAARYTGRLEATAGRLPWRGPALERSFFVPWITRSLGALLVIAIDSVARLQSYED